MYRYSGTTPNISTGAQATPRRHQSLAGRTHHSRWLPQECLGADRIVPVYLFPVQGEKAAKAEKAFPLLPLKRRRIHGLKPHFGHLDRPVPVWIGEIFKEPLTIFESYHYELKAWIKCGSNL